MTSVFPSTWHRTHLIIINERVRGTGQQKARWSERHWLVCHWWARPSWSGLFFSEPHCLCALHWRTWIYLRALSEVPNPKGTTLSVFLNLRSCPEIVTMAHFSTPSLSVDEYLGLVLSLDQPDVPYFTCSAAVTGVTDPCLRACSSGCEPCHHHYHRW